MKKTLLLFTFLLLSSNAFASVTAEEAYDIARMELFPMDYKAEYWYIIRNETSHNYYEEGSWRKPYEITQIESRLEGKKYWAVVFKIERLFYYIYVDSTNGKIIASYPSHDVILKYYSRKSGIISMDAAIAIADGEIAKRNIELEQLILKIDKDTLANIYGNYSAIRPKLSEIYPREKTKPIWEVIYRRRGESKERNIVVLIDAVSGELLYIKQ